MSTNLKVMHMLMLTISLIITVTSKVVMAQTDEETQRLKEKAATLHYRLEHLEPVDPSNIEDPPWEDLDFPETVRPITDVIQTGSSIPFETIIDKPTYKRPAYEAHWHSTVGRWSYVPIRVHYALHRLFTNYDIGMSSWYDFEHHLGLSIPVLQNEEALDLYIVTFQTEVTDVYTKGNQVVVVGHPKRTGVEVTTITTADIHPSNKEENLLIQLATPDGDELDYSLITYVEPDFWAKRRQE